MWYFKINARIENQNRLIYLLEKLSQDHKKNENLLGVLSNPDNNNVSNITTTPNISKNYCAQCGMLISIQFPIITSEDGIKKYFCSDDCRLNNLEQK